MAVNWLKNKPVDSTECFCDTRDIFQAKLEMMLLELLNLNLPEQVAYDITSIVGEIGNNSFDHNLGNWPKEIGIFFAAVLFENKLIVILADKGQGILKTLKKAKPELNNDKDALNVAFYEKISGRIAENRGNGLKFVRQNIEKNNMHLVFASGCSKVSFNGIKKEEILNDCIYGCFAKLEVNL